MRKIAILLLTVLAVTPALAGCLGANPLTAQSAGTAAPLPAGAFDALDVLHADLVQRNATSVTFAWNASAPPTTALPVAGTVGPEGTAMQLKVPAPAGELFTLGVAMNWSGGADLDLYVLNATGGALCSSPGYQDPQSGTGGSEACSTTPRAPLETPTNWTVRVVSYDDPHPGGMPFHLVLTYAVAQPVPVLGPPLPLVDNRTPSLGFAPPVPVSKHQHTGEPSIRVDPQGTIYVAGPTGPQASLFRSTDDGASFQPVNITGMPPFPMGGGDSAIALNGTQDLYFGDLSGACITVSASHDGGATWTNDPLACDLPLVDRQWLATDGSDVVWLAFNGQNGATVMKSLDGGRTFPLRSYVPEQGGCTRGNLAYANATGVLYLAGCTADGPGVGVSTDGGLSWTWHTVAPRSDPSGNASCYTCNIFTVVAVDTAGNPYVVWSDPSGGEYDVWLATSTDDGASWHAPVRVNAGNGTHIMPWIAAGAPGHAVVVWYGTRDQAAPGDVRGEWYALAAETDDALSASPTFHGGLVTPDPVQYGPICTTGSSCGGHRNLLDFFQVALDGAGHPHVAYVDGRHGGTYRNSLVMYAGVVG